jgi:hypothetical protein
LVIDCSPKGYDPDGYPWNDLNHVWYTPVLVDDSNKRDGREDLWLVPRGFKVDNINRESSIQWYS